MPNLPHTCLCILALLLAGSKAASSKGSSSKDGGGSGEPLQKPFVFIIPAAS